MKLDLYVTQDDIDAGILRSPTDCAIAHAMKRQHEEFAHVSVDDLHIIAMDKDRNVIKRWQTGVKIRNWITEFDQGKKVRPLRIVETPCQLA